MLPRVVWVVSSQLGLQGRVDWSKPNYDPVAERMLPNPLDAQSPTDARKEPLR